MASFDYICTKKGSDRFIYFYSNPETLGQGLHSNVFFAMYLSESCCLSVFVSDL